MFSQNSHSKTRNRGDIVEHYVTLTFGGVGVNPTLTEQGGVAVWTATWVSTGLFKLKAAVDLNKRPGFHVNHQVSWVANSKTAEVPLVIVPVAAAVGSAFPWTQATGELFFKCVTPAGVLTDPALNTQCFLEIVQRQNKISASNL